MNKTTLRFIAVGAVLIVSTLALMLAQHDARQRPREAIAPVKSKPVDPEPIELDEVPDWRSSKRASTARTVVRANDNQSFAPPSLEYQPNAGDDQQDLHIADLSHQSLSSSAAPATTNSLRPTSSIRQLTADTEGSLEGVQPLGEIESNSSVEPAAGQTQDRALPPTTGMLPAAPLPSTMPSAMPSSLPSVPTAGNSNEPRLPTTALPTNNAPSTSRAALGGSPAPPWVNGNAGAPPARPASASSSLSDTQLPAMPPTTLPPATALPSTGLPTASSLPSMPSMPVNGAPTNSATNNGANAPASGAGRPSNDPSWLQAPPQSAGAQAGGVRNMPTSTGPQFSNGPDAAMRRANDISANNASSNSFNNLPPAAYPSANSTSSPSGTTSGFGSNGLPNGMSSNRTSAQLASQSTAQDLAQPVAATLGTPHASARTALAGTAFGTLISNQPGSRQLDGSQNPVMLIQKRMPEECQVGKRATVIITVRNAGNSAAQDVEVIDTIPNGARFAESMPAVTPTAEGILVWKLGEMGPGDERTITLQIVPERQGELGSTAAVRFAAQASMRTLATLPKLELVPSASADVLIGSPHSIDVTVKNIGTGMARAVRLEADLPRNVRHESGDASLEASFGDIAPGDSKRIRLDSIATEPGAGVCMIRALTEDGLQQEQKVDLQVLAPALEAAISGPNRRYLDRQATFEIMIKNSGTAPARHCEFVLRLPAGLNFNTANKAGAYDPTIHAVRWSVDEFPAGHAEPVEVTVLPVEIGQQLMTFQGNADLGITTEARGGLTVEEQGELTFTIDQDADPIEVSSSTTYTVEVRNVGRVDRNIELVVQMPPGSQVLKVDAPVASRVEGDQLRFEPIPQMDSRTSVKFRMEVRHAKVGVQIVRAQLKSQNRPTLVIKEEATEVYNDKE